MDSHLLSAKNGILILQKYEEQIDTLQRKVMEQSMTMSMYSSITPDEFRGGADEDVFGEYIYIFFNILYKTSY